MKNKEKFREILEDFVLAQVPYGLDKNGEPVPVYSEKCTTFPNNMEKIAWLNKEYKQPEVDWSKVAVDTPIYVKDFYDEKWYKVHFAKYENGIVYAWSNGETSRSCNDVIRWKYAKLAESEECEILRLRGYSSCLNYIVEHPKEAEKIVMKCAKDNPIKTNADKFKLYNIKRMIDDYAGRLNDKNIIGVTEDEDHITYDGKLYRKVSEKVRW